MPYDELGNYYGDGGDRGDCSVQAVAPQETEITSYVVGGVKKDVTTDTFKGFSL